jgi:hypothetical protein
MILDRHLAVVIDPQFTDDNIMHRRRNFAPRVMIFESAAEMEMILIISSITEIESLLFKFQMRYAQWNNR